MRDKKAQLRFTSIGLLALTLSLAGCFFDEYDSTLFAYDPTSPYADVLAECVNAQKTSDSCKLSTLPTIGMETPSPTIKDIMERVVVSDEWMGKRFEELLEALPSDILSLTQAVTAVVIGADIRPSYYWNLTGAIYLDPGNLWLTAKERGVISTDPDYRSAYSDPMAFRSFWRWTKGSEDAWPWVGTNNKGTRPLNDIIPAMASLLFHELAHANDLFPLAAYEDVSMNDTIYSASNKVYTLYPSTILMNDNGLESQAMINIANILYKGSTPSTEDTDITAAQVGVYFESDIASDDYAYTSQYEDLAMLFEEAMMKIHFDIDRDTAFVTPPSDDSTECDDFIVGWGIRNRLGDNSVLPRAQFALKSLLPEQDYTAELNNFPLPTALPINTGWCSSRLLQPVFEKSTGIRTNTEVLRHDHYTRPHRLIE